MDLPIHPALLLRQPRCQLQDATLRPPALCPDDEGAEIPWVLLAWSAYVAERNNATTAFSETRDGHRIQVSVFLARPPRVSYMCVFCPGLEHTVFPLESKILDMEEDLILLRIIVTSKNDIFEDADNYIYQAADEAAGGRPSLKRLPRLPSNYGVDLQHVGILRCGTSYQRRHVMRPHRDIAGDFYIVAGLCREAYDADAGDFVLCLYNSNFPSSWTIQNISLDERHRRQYGRSFHHVNSKVITIGGDAGTMGFVDLWRGILLCDVLKVEQGKPTPSLRYVMLPPPLLPNVEDSCDSELARDIAIVQQGRTIKYVELQVHWKPCPTSRGGYIKDGWMSRMWSRPVAADCSDDGWDVVCKQESSDITVDSMVLDGGGMPLELNSLVVCQPTLSLCDDDTVYFMAKKNRMDHKGWVIAVDMQNKTIQKKNSTGGGCLTAPPYFIRGSDSRLPGRENPPNSSYASEGDFFSVRTPRGDRTQDLHQRKALALLRLARPAMCPFAKTIQGVAEFAAERTVGMSFTYIHSRISKYLTAGQGAMENLKRPGTVLLGSSNKKPRSWVLDVNMPPWDNEQEQQDTKMEDSGDVRCHVGVQNEMVTRVGHSVF